MTDQTTRDAALLAVADEWARTPWEPPGLTFEVGDRVRIRLSAECRMKFVVVDDDDRPLSAVADLEHEWECDGEIGTILQIDYGPWCLGRSPEGHYYIVECDHGFEPFAACELQPLPTEAP